MKIRIKGIFRKYDTEFDFNKKNAIYIGENGVGKSTSIKILNCVLTLDFVSILEYYFSEIEFIDEDKIMNFTYGDFALQFEYIKQEYVGTEKYECFKLVEDIDSRITNLYLLGNLNSKHLKHLNVDISDDIISECQHFYLPQIKKIKELINKCHYKLLKFDKRKLKSELIGFPPSDYIVSGLKKIYTNANICDEFGKYYVNSNISNLFFKIKEFIDKLNFRQSFILNLANDFNVTNDIEFRYATNEIEEKLFKEKKENDNKPMLERGIGKNSGVYQKLVNTYDLDEVINKYQIYYEEYQISNDFNISKYLFTSLYSKDILNEFVKDYYTFLYDNIDKPEEIKLDYMLKDVSFEKIKLFIAPLLPNHSIFDDILNSNYNVFFTNVDEIKILLKFYKIYFDKYFKNDKLDKLNLLFSKYFKNKYVVATPSGISISSDNDFKNDIDYDDLSSGEKKLIILFTISIFSENMIILFDEPETSLSVVWQKELINDLEKSSNYKNLIVCTQSPFIVDDDMINNVICLPMGDNNK